MGPSPPSGAGAPRFLQNPWITVNESLTTAPERCVAARSGTRRRSAPLPAGVVPGPFEPLRTEAREGAAVRIRRFVCIPALAAGLVPFPGLAGGAPGGGSFGLAWAPPFVGLPLPVP